MGEWPNEGSVSQTRSALNGQKTHARLACVSQHAFSRTATRRRRAALFISIQAALQEAAGTVRRR